MRLILFFFLFIFSSIAVSAQQEGSIGSVNPFYAVQSHENWQQGQVTIKQSQAIEQMMLLYILINQKSPGVEGYRIQLFSGTGAKARQEAQNVKSQFLTAFPNEKITIEYKAPFWSVRVGYFRHKHESLPLLRSLRPIFPNSYAVRDAAIRLELFE